MSTRVLAAASAGLIACTAFAADVIWWEGEAAVATNFREHPWLEMSGQARDGLSGGDWLTLMHKEDAPEPEGGSYFAHYRVQVPQSSRYHLWVRESLKARTLANRWRFDDQPWTEAGRDIPATDRILLASDRAIEWCRYGEVQLDAGDHAFEVEIPAAVGQACFDCFVLYRGRFEPAGKRKPASDVPQFYEYPENERVEAILQAKREAAEALQRLKDEVAASAVNRVDFSQVGREVDVVRFGTDYEAEFSAHNGQGRMDRRSRNALLGRERFAEWSFVAPQPGDYVVTIGADIARLPDRRGELSILLGGEWKAYGQIAEAGQYHCLVTLPQGETRFRLANVGGALFYTSGARLSAVRGDPWEDASPGDHPRLQFTRDEIARIQQAIAPNADHPVRYYYDGLLAAADQQVTRPSNLNGPRASAQALNEVAVAYALTGKPEYGDRGADYLMRLAERDFGRNPNSVLGNGEYLDSVGWGYDALYDHLTEQQRKAVRERLDTEAHWLWVQMRTLCKDTIHGWWASDHSNNWQAVAAGGLGVAALSLLGESADAGMWLEEATAQVKLLLDGGFDSDGAYFESPMYHKYAMNYLTPFATALLRAGGENLFGYRDRVLHKTCLYNLYMMEPTRDHFAPFNDGRRLAGRPPQALHPCGAYFARLSSVYRDGLVRWLFDSMYGPGRRVPVWNFQHGHPDAVVWYDAAVPIEDPDTSPRLALARYWPEHGRVALRTGWNDPNGLLFAMECGLYGSHGHADQGGFILTAYGEHLVDDTGYGGWEAESEAHSVVLIDGKGQRKQGMLGGIRDFVHTAAMDYFEADATAAYHTPESPVERVKRHVLFMRPGYFVIVDDVRKDDEPHEWQWLLHSKVQPPTHEVLVRQMDQITFQGENAALEVRVISPEAPQSRVVKKQGHTFLSVAPPSPRPDAVFFAVLHPTSADRSVSPVAPTRTDTLVGARVGDDLVLWRQEAGEWEHGGLKADSQFAACRKEPLSVFAKSARSVQYSGLALTASQPITAILLEGEARLVLPAPTSISFGRGYMAGAAVYQTDQDRDLANDKRVGQVDGNGRVELPAGAFTIRAPAAQTQDSAPKAPSHELWVGVNDAQPQ